MLFRRFWSHILMLLLFCTPCYALFFNSASVLDPRKTVLGLAPYAALGGEWGLFLVNEYGILEKLNSVLRLGFVRRGASDLYAGLELKYLLFRFFSGSDNFSLLAGGHYSHCGVLDAGIVLGNEFRGFEHYIGLDFDIEFDSPKTRYPADFVVGVKTAYFTGKNQLVLEGGIPVTSYSRYKLGFSFRYPF